MNLRVDAPTKNIATPQDEAGKASASGHLSDTSAAQSIRLKQRSRTRRARVSTLPLSLPPYQNLCRYRANVLGSEREYGLPLWVLVPALRVIHIRLDKPRLRFVSPFAQEQNAPQLVIQSARIPQPAHPQTHDEMLCCARNFCDEAHQDSTESIAVELS